MEGVPQFADFVHAVVECDLPVTERDIELSLYYWKTLDFEQQIAAVDGLYARRECGEFENETYRPLPQNYLDKRMWKRPLRLKKTSRLDRLMEGI